MRELRKCLIVTLVLVLSIMGLSLRAQDSLVFHRNFIGLTLTELPCTDFRLSYERRIRPAHGFKIELGYKPATRYFTDATNINLGQDATGWCYRSTASWYYASLGYRYYMNRKRNLYVSPEIFYKYMDAEMIMYSWGLVNSDYSRNAFEVRTMHCNMGGLNLLVGKRAPIRFSKGFHMGIDFFGGMTIRLKFLETWTYGHVEVSHYHDEGVGVISIPVSDTPDISNTSLFQFMVQGGIILFASW